MDPGDDLAERTLPRPILTAQRVAGARRDLERDVGERLRAGKSLADALEPDGGDAHCLPAGAAVAGSALEADAGAPEAAGSARYFGSTSVKPHDFSCRAQSPRFSFDTRTSSIGMTGFAGDLLSWILSKIVRTPTSPHR